MPDTTGSECSGNGRGSHVGQKHFEKAEKESPESLCYTSMPKSVSGDRGVDRTTTAAAWLVLVCRITRTKRFDERRNERPEEICDATKQFNRKIGEKQGEMGRPHGKDGCRHTSKESGRER